MQVLQGLQGKVETVGQNTPVHTIKVGRQENVKQDTRQQSIKIKQEVANRRQRQEKSGEATLHRNTKKKTVFIFFKNKTVRTSIVKTSGTILVKVL